MEGPCYFWADWGRQTYIHTSRRWRWSSLWKHNLNRAQNRLCVNTYDCVNNNIRQICRFHITTLDVVAISTCCCSRFPSIYNTYVPTSIYTYTRTMAKGLCPPVTRFVSSRASERRLSLTLRNRFSFPSIFQQTEANDCEFVSIKFPSRKFDFQAKAFNKTKSSPQFICRQVSICRASLRFVFCDWTLNIFRPLTYHYSSCVCFFASFLRSFVVLRL